MDGASVKEKCLYPLFFNKERSWTEGRRVNKELAICNPTTDQIISACKSLGLPSIVEGDKRHPREPFTAGRVRVQWTDENGIFLNCDLHSKQSLLNAIALAMPKTEARNNTSLPAAVKSTTSPVMGNEVKMVARATKKKGKKK